MKLAGTAIRLGLLTAAIAVALSAPAQAAPPNAEVVFSNGGRIMKMDSQGADREVLFGKGRAPNNDGFGAIEPAVSPDGEKITFGFRRDATYDGLIDIWVMNADGTGARKLLTSTEKKRFGDPEFTPGGRVIVAGFTRNGRRAVAKVFTMETSGSTKKNILQWKQRVRPWMDWRHFAEPSVSPDGGKLLYLVDSGYDGAFADSGYGAELRVMNLTTRKSRELAEHSLGGDWSPDGIRIVFSEVDGNGDEDFCWSGDYQCFDFSRIRMVDADGSNGRYLTAFRKDVADERRPDWTGPGRILFESTRGPDREIAETTEIWSIQPGGQCLTRLTNGSPASLSPVLVNPEGKLTGPRKCGGIPPGPNREIGAPETRASETTLWLGKSFRNVLLSWTNVEPGSSQFYYADCGAIPASGCRRGVIIYNEDVCNARGYAAAVMGSVAIQEQRGIPVMRSTKPGRETPPYTMGFSGRTMFFMIGGSGLGDRRQQNRLEIDALREVGESKAEGDLPAPRIPAGDIRQMKQVERIYKRTGSVSRTARILEQGSYFVRSNLSFARKYKAVGGYDTVRCPRGKAFQSESGSDSDSARLRDLDLP